MHERDISRKLKENGAKNGSARARSRRVLPYSANWVFSIIVSCLSVKIPSNSVFVFRPISPLIPLVEAHFERKKFTTIIAKVIVDFYTDVIFLNI